jgi:type III restriction enzyme
LNVGRRLSEMPKSPWSWPTVAAAKCVFNLVPCDNKFEPEFAQLLRDADDVEQFGFVIEYTDARGNLRYYEPDFVAVLLDGAHYLIETKGREDVDVTHKDRAARLWCENATQLTATRWEYLKVPQTEYARLRPTRFADLLALASR